MSDSHPPLHPPSHPSEPPTDVAALAAGIAAVAIALFASPGPYDPICFVTSLTLLAVIFAHVAPQRRTPVHSLAFATATGLAFVPAVGFFAELALGSAHIHDVLNDIGTDTRVPDWQIALIWLAIAITTYLIDRRKQRGA